MPRGGVRGVRQGPEGEQQHRHVVVLRPRRQVQRRLGYDDDRAGDARAAADAGCAGLWESIRERADQVARLNRTNGLLIGIRLEHNQRMLNFIEEAAGKGLYGPDGQARAAGGHVSSRV